MSSLLSGLLDWGKTSGPRHTDLLETFYNSPDSFNDTGSLLKNLTSPDNQNLGTDWGGLFKDYGGLALGAAQGLGSLFMGMKQYGLSKDILNENKRQYDQNYTAQRDLTNARLEDRQKARIAADPTANYRSVAEYMSKYGVK